MGIIAAIDPGLTGAIALYDPDLEWLEVHDMPVVPHDKKHNKVSAPLLRDILSDDDIEKCFVEYIIPGGIPGKTSKFRNFSMGQSSMAAEAVALTMNIPTELVPPAEWKKHFKLTGKDKSHSRAAAISLFPKYAELFKRVKDDGRAEAVLIAVFGARK